jgi:phosphoribosylaminoimidazole-succinocarboxamide synthase
MYPTVINTTASEGFLPSKQGKVRDLYDLGDSLLIVATDRLSAFDVILPDGIPNKGKVLTQISAFWFALLQDRVPNHVISLDIADFPEPFRSAPEVFAGRSMLVRKTRPHGSVCGLTLPPGLRESEKLPGPIFTPTTKAEQGLHDENISFAQVEDLVGPSLASRLNDLSIDLYSRGAQYASTRGIIIADTKFEFGTDDRGNLFWIDEALTPDSSRFWPMDRYVVGGPQPSFDKQFVRDYLLGVRWDKRPPAPSLPPEIIATTAEKYVEALVTLTGRSLS